jgi:hypothetical protein
MSYRWRAKKVTNHLPPTTSISSLLFAKRREAHVAQDGRRDESADVHGVHARAEGDAQEDVQQEHQEHDGSDDHTADRHGFAHLLLTFSGTRNRDRP